jgi:polysaccharide biosynthesis protein PslG
MSRLGWHMMTAAICTLAFLLLGRQPVAAADPWQLCGDGLPSFAQVLTLGAVPDQPGTLWAGANGRPGIWLSGGDDRPWQPVPGSPPTYTFLWDAGRQAWWAGTAEGLLLRPVDGTRWQADPSLTGPVLDLALDSRGHMYAVWGQQGLVVSSAATDLAGTWAPLHDEPQALSIAVSPGGSDLYLGTAGRGLWVSHDSGGRWEQAPNIGDDYVKSVRVVPQHGAVVACGQRRLYHSLDKGRTWAPVSGLPDRPSALALAPDGELLVGLTGGIARSHDVGLNWTLCNQGLPAGATVLDIAVSCPEDSVIGCTLFAVAGDGIYRSHDSGRTFERHDAGLGGPQVNSLASDGSGGLVAATRMGLYRRPADEDTWELVAPDSCSDHVYSLARHDASGLLYAGTQHGLLTSCDGGATWEDATSELTAHGVFGVLVDPADPQHMYIRVAYERIYESHDAGETWTALWEGMETHHVVLSMAYTPSGELWSGTQEGLFHWDPAAARWQFESVPLPPQSVLAIAFDPEDGRLYAGTTTAVWAQSTSGEWRRCRSGPNYTVTALAVVPDGQIYAGTRSAGPGYGGLHRSCDGGATWQQVTGVPADSSVYALLPDETKPGAIYASTSTGVYHVAALACPSSAPDGAGAGGSSASLRAFMAWARQAYLARTYPRPQPLPAVHTLLADDARLQEARDIGFRAVVQVFSWYEILPSPKEWHWQVPDFVVRAAGYYGLDLIVRLDQPPGWALPSDGATAALPFDLHAYLEFIETVARRYRGHVRAYIIWNEPNLAVEWGAPPDPEAYAYLLQRAYAAIKQADPAALVVSAGLAPTNEQSKRALDDCIFLGRMLQAGALPFLDALGTHPYGFAYPPDDPEGEHDGLNMNRLLDLQAILAVHGAPFTPIWATETGWTTSALGEESWLAVTPQQQADYLVRAWEMAGSTFPTLELFTVWNLSTGLPQDDEKAGYSLLEQDGTPKPAFRALQSALSSCARSPIVDPWAVWDRLLARAAPVAILATDAEVHLGDSE